MENKMTDPYNNILETNPNKGIIRQELVTYEMKDNVLYKSVVIRTFHKDGDYTDTKTVIPLL
jgi:hypothetical protein